MPIDDLLEQDHQIINKLLKKISELGAETSIEKQYYFYQCKKEITIHSKTEEKIFYDIFKKFNPIGIMTQHAKNEHHEIELMLTNLSKNSLNDAEWHYLFNQMAASFMHHIEQESSLIKSALAMLTVEEAKSLGEMMEQQKQIEEKLFYFSIKAEAKLNGLIILE